MLPVPEPYGTQRIANTSIEKSLPDAVGAYVDWLINESGWKIAERPDSDWPTYRSGIGRDRVSTRRARTPRSHPGASHLSAVSPVYQLRRRHDPPYVRALEARGIPHLLVGGRSFHNRAEIETLRAALAAIEWPDDELSVFATLRGALFAIGDEELLEYRDRFGAFTRFGCRPDECPAQRLMRPSVDRA